MDLQMMPKDKRNQIRCSIQLLPNEQPKTYLEQRERIMTMGKDYGTEQKKEHVWCYLKQQGAQREQSGN